MQETRFSYEWALAAVVRALVFLKSRHVSWQPSKHKLLSSLFAWPPKVQNLKRYQVQIWNNKFIKNFTQVPKFEIRPSSMFELEVQFLNFKFDFWTSSSIAELQVQNFELNLGSTFWPSKNISSSVSKHGSSKQQFDSKIWSWCSRNGTIETWKCQKCEIRFYCYVLSSKFQLHISSQNQFNFLRRLNS